MQSSRVHFCIKYRVHRLVCNSNRASIVVICIRCSNFCMDREYTKTVVLYCSTTCSNLKQDFEGKDKIATYLSFPIDLKVTSKIEKVNLKLTFKLTTVMLRLINKTHTLIDITKLSDQTIYIFRFCS